uniref:ENT domain-containing protein n=1 Tax=Tanacetum cinerariifolium TaxID=118510 RepID=A0A699J1F3_TANCI|nr:hypothetical protein [Tanacetum cinerariifolium]
MDFYLKDICFDAQNNHNLKESVQSVRKRGKASDSAGISTEKVDDVNINRDMKENINGTNGSETDSVVGSSGSCSTNGYVEFYHGGAEIYHGDTDQSDTDKAWADEIHRQELNAYRSTLDAFYASGPLTWEKETMVTNLRLSLHISNDEHLVMQKNLISASSSCHDR